MSYNFDKIIQESIRMDENKSSTVVSWQDIFFRDGALVIENSINKKKLGDSLSNDNDLALKFFGNTRPDLQQCDMEGLSFKQMLDKLSTSIYGSRGKNIAKGASYLWDVCPADMRDSHMNVWLDAAGQLSPDKKVKLLQYEDNEGSVVRATVSESFTNHIGITEFVEIVQEVLEPFNEIGEHYEITEFNLTRDDIHLRVTFPNRGRQIGRDDNGGGYFASGFIFKCNEIAKGAYAVVYFIQNAVCTNSTQVETSDKKSHRFTDRNSIRTMIKLQVTELLRNNEELMDHIEESWHRAASERVDTIHETIGFLCKHHGISEYTDEAIANAYRQGGETTLGVVNGLTWVSQKIENQAVRQDIEQLAHQFFTGTRRVPVVNVEEKTNKYIVA